MKNPLWFVVWLLILIFIAFFVAGFCAGWYIFIYPLTVCIPALSIYSFKELNSPIIAPKE